MVAIERIHLPFPYMGYRTDNYTANYKHYRTVVFSWISGNYGDHISCYHSLTCCYDKKDRLFRFTTRFGSDTINNELIDVETAVSIFEYLTGYRYDSIGNIPFGVFEVL